MYAGRKKTKVSWNRQGVILQSIEIEELLDDKGAFYNGTEAPTGGVLYSHKFCKFQRKPSLMKSPFIKVAGLSSATLLIRDSSTGFFLWNLQNFKEHLFCRTSANGSL